MERRKCTYTLFRYLLYLCLSDGFVFLYCRGWIYGNGVLNPNSILGVLVRENFPGLVQLPGPDEVPQPGLKWELYCAVPAPPDTTINGVECHTRADMVINGFWVISVSHNKIMLLQCYLISALISVVSCYCRSTTRSMSPRSRRRRTCELQRPRASCRTQGTRCECR